MEDDKWSAIVEKTFDDNDFKKRLMADPKRVLLEEGIKIPDGVTIKVVESTPSETWLVLPCHREHIKFLSPYVAVHEVDGVEVPGCDPEKCKNPAAGCAEL